MEGIQQAPSTRGSLAGVSRPLGLLQGRREHAVCLAGQRARVVYAGLSASGTASCTAFTRSISHCCRAQVCQPANPPPPPATAAAAVAASQLAGCSRSGAAPDGPKCFQTRRTSWRASWCVLQVQLGICLPAGEEKLPWTAGVCLGIKATPALCLHSSPFALLHPAFEEHSSAPCPRAAPPLPCWPCWPPPRWWPAHVPSARPPTAAA